MKLVNLDLLLSPGLHVFTDFCHSVPEPDFEYLLVALHSRYGALGVAEEGYPVGQLAEARQDRGDQSGEQ